MKIFLAILVSLSIPTFTFGQAENLDDLERVYHELDSNGNLLEIRWTGEHYDFTTGEQINIPDTIIISLENRPDTINDTLYRPIDSHFEGYQEKWLKAVFRSIILDNKLQSVESFYYCLNGQLIEHLPCENGRYVRYYCNGNIKEQSDSCKWCESAYCLNIGFTRYYYPDGTLESEGVMTNDLPDGHKRVQIFTVGEWKYYDQKGRLTKKIQFDEFGKFIREEEIKKEKN